MNDYLVREDGLVTDFERNSETGFVVPESGVVASAG